MGVEETRMRAATLLCKVHVTKILKIVNILLLTPPGLFFRNNLRHWLGTFSRLLMAQFPSNEGSSNVRLKYCLIRIVVVVCIKFPASFTRTSC